MKKLLKWAMPHLIAIVIFNVVCILFFSPIFFEGKKVYQPDIQQVKSMSKELRDFREQQGEEGIWTNAMFSGMPGYFIDVKYNKGVFFLFQLVTNGLPHPSRIIYLAMFSFYILLIVFGVRPYLAIIGGICFGLSTFSIISLVAGHNGKVAVIALIPLLVAGLQLIYDQRKWLTGSALVAIALALIFYMNHLQIIYYTLMLCIIFTLNYLIFSIREKSIQPFIKSTLFVVVAIIIGVGANTGKLWSSYEYSKYSIRGEKILPPAEGEAREGLTKTYAFSWSNSIDELFTLFIPNYYGGASGYNVGEKSNMAQALAQAASPGQIRNFVKAAPMYWGDQPFTEGPVYVGAIICFLFIIGIFFAPKKYKIWMLIACLLSFMLSLGDSLAWFNYFMFDHVPLFNKFRAVTMAICIAMVIIPLLGFIGLESFLNQTDDQRSKKMFYWAIAITGGLCLGIYLMANGFSYESQGDARLASQPEWLLEAIRADRMDLLKSDAIRSLIFVGLAFASIYFFAIQKRFSLPVFCILFGGLCLVDLWTVNKRYFTKDDYRRASVVDHIKPTDADLEIMKDKGPNYRVFDLAGNFNSALASHFHKSVGGYHAAKLQRYQDLIDKHLSQEMQTFVTSLRDGIPIFDQIPVLNMLNTRYFKYGSEKNAFVKNPKAMGNGWLVSNVKTVASPDEEIKWLSQVDLGNTAVLLNDQPIKESYSREGSITNTHCQPNELRYEIIAKDEALAVFSEIYYPKGWHATIDGQDVPILRANYALRALEIPPGKHEVVFTFMPTSYKVGSAIGLVCFILLIGGLGFTLYKRVKESGFIGAEQPEME